MLTSKNLENTKKYQLLLLMIGVFLKLSRSEFVTSDALPGSHERTGDQNWYPQTVLQKQKSSGPGPWSGAGAHFLVGFPDRFGEITKGWPSHVAPFIASCVSGTVLKQPEDCSGTSATGSIVLLLETASGLRLPWLLVQASQARCLL